MLDLVEAAASASDADLNVEVVDDAFLTAQGIESELPLWADDPLWAAWAQVDVSQGDRRRPALPADRGHGGGDARPHATSFPGVGLEPEREAELLAAWHAR